jgi:hypothetical protein
MSESKPQHSVAWTFQAAVSVEHVAMAFGAPWTLVSDRARNIYVLDHVGGVRGELRAGQPVRGLRAGQRGAPFTALAGQAVVYAFDAAGQLEWRVEFGSPVVSFDADPAVRQLAAVSAAGWLHLYSTETRERYVAPVGWPLGSVALLDTDPLRVAVANERGRLAVLNHEGKVEWEKQLGCKSGHVSLSRGAGLLALPAYQMGVVLFDLNGNEAGRVDVGATVRGAALSAGAAFCVAETEGDRIVVATVGSSVAWERELAGPPAAWAVSSDGKLVVVATGAREVAAFRTGKAPPAEPGEEDKFETKLMRVGEPSGESDFELEERELEAGPPHEPAAEEDADYLEIEDLLSEHFGEEDAEGAAEPPAVAPELAAVAEAPTEVVEEEGPAPAAPGRGRRVAWKKKLPSYVLPDTESAFRLSADGRFLVTILRTGRVLVLDALGEQPLRSRTRTPARIVPRVVESCAALLAKGSLVALDLENGQEHRIGADGAELLCADCAARGGLVCTADADGILRAFRVDGEPLWRKKVKAEANVLLVSPDGGTVLMGDEDGRFRLYDGEGNLTSKFRFADAGYRALGLGEGFTVFADPEDRLMVLEANGEERWYRRVLRDVRGLEVLGETLAVYGPPGVCAAVDAEEGEVWQMRPPPGLMRVRRPEGGEPVVVHAAGSAITTFTGYKRKLAVAWRYTCAGDVTLLEADAEARAVLALAAERVYRIERTRPF